MVITEATPVDSKSGRKTPRSVHAQRRPTLHVPSRDPQRLGDPHSFSPLTSLLLVILRTETFYT